MEISCRLENAQALVKIDKINVSTYMVALLLKVRLEAPVFTSLTVEFCSMRGMYVIHVVMIVNRNRAVVMSVAQCSTLL